MSIPINIALYRPPDINIRIEFIGNIKVDFIASNFAYAHQMIDESMVNTATSHVGSLTEFSGDKRLAMTIGIAK